MKSKILFFLILLTSCSAERLMKMAESKDKNAVLKHSKELSEEDSKENWPPSVTNPDGQPRYKKGTLGYALNTQFRSHCSFCGLEPNIINPDNKDYVPKDITKFTGTKPLDVTVEQADYFTGGLLFYIFKESERNTNLEQIPFSDTYVLDKNYVNQFDIKPSDFSDYFLMTKTCGGYINSKLDGKINPPFVSVQAAIQSDLEQKSTILAMKGKFYSPLTDLINGGTYLSINAYMKLWALYLRQEEYRDKSYFLREFSGVMIKRVASSKAANSLSASVGLNYSSTMDASIAASIAAGLKTESAFAGRDWQTIVFSDFSTQYPRMTYFTPLPKVDDILQKFRSITPIYKPGQIEYFIKDDEHKHFIRIYGIPSELCEGFWKIEMPNNNVYRTLPSIQASRFTDADGRFGCEFEIKGTPNDAIVSGASVNVEYTIKSNESIDSKFIEFPIKLNIGTSLIPTLKVSGGQKVKHQNLNSEGSGKYSIRWIAFIDVFTDNKDIVDFTKDFKIQKITSYYQSNEYPITVNSVESIQDRKQIKITFTSNSNYTLDQIDESSQSLGNINFEVVIPKKPNGTSIKPITFEILMPLKQ